MLSKKSIQSQTLSVYMNSEGLMWGEAPQERREEDKTALFCKFLLFKVNIVNVVHSTGKYVICTSARIFIQHVYCPYSVCLWMHCYSLTTTGSISLCQCVRAFFF